MKVDDVNNSDGKASLKRQKLGTIAQFFHFVAEEKKKKTTKKKATKKQTFYDRATTGIPVKNCRMDFDMSSPKIVLLNKV